MTEDEIRNAIASYRRLQQGALDDDDLGLAKVYARHLATLEVMLRVRTGSG